MSRIKIFNSESLVQNKKTQLYIIIQYCFPGRTWKLDTLTDLEQNIFLKQNKLLLKVYNKKITFTIKLLQLSLPSLKILFLSDYQEYRVRISDLFKDGHRTVWDLVPWFPWLLVSNCCISKWSVAWITCILSIQCWNDTDFEMKTQD